MCLPNAISIVVQGEEKFERRPLSCLRSPPRMKKPAPPFSRPHVALLIESSRAYGRGLLQGVAKYVREHGPWYISLQERSFGDEVPIWLEKWQGDGIITRLDNVAMAGAVRRWRVPTVYLRNVPPELKVPSVLTDNAAVSRAAFEHLHDRGFRHFAFCGFNGADYSDERRNGFVNAVTAIGLRAHVYAGEHQPPDVNAAGYEHEGLKDAEHVAEWIKELPKPIGLMACNDMRGQQVLDACRAVGVAVPDDVAVVGADNDEVLCDLSNPTLSSVVPNTQRIGYEAAALLARMMSGRKGPRPALYIGPIGVVTRRSSEVLAIEDRQIAAAAHFIREHACEGIDVGDLLRAVPLSRSTLERRFGAIMGRSPKEEILRVRLSRAKQLLVETDFSLSLIAEKLGLEHTEYFGRIFKKKFGLTPGRFRTLSRAGDTADKLPVPVGQ